MIKEVNLSQKQKAILLVLKNNEDKAMTCAEVGEQIGFTSQVVASNIQVMKKRYREWFLPSHRVQGKPVYIPHLRTYVRDKVRTWRLSKDFPFTVEDLADDTGLFQHKDGDVYQFESYGEMKHPETGEWLKAVAYRWTKPPFTMCFTTLERWASSFQPYVPCQPLVPMIEGTVTGRFKEPFKPEMHQLRSEVENEIKPLRDALLRHHGIKSGPLNLIVSGTGSKIRPHKWIPSTLGHGETMCEYCHITNREAAAVGMQHHCDRNPENEDAGTGVP